MNKEKKTGSFIDKNNVEVYDRHIPELSTLIPSADDVVWKEGQAGVSRSYKQSPDARQAMLRGGSERFCHSASMQKSIPGMVYSCSMLQSKGAMEQKERLGGTMSYTHAILCNNCIVLASDSRSVCLDEAGRITSWDDGFQKVMYLENLGIGLVMAGYNAIGKVPVCDFIRKQFVQIHIQESDGIYPSFAAICGCLECHIPKGQHINIACGGFENGEAVLYHADLCYGKETIIHKGQFFWCVNGHLTNMFKVPDAGMSVPLGSIKTMLDFSDFLVNTEIQAASFKEGIPAVGGPIQTLLMEESGAKWIHPLY